MLRINGVVPESVVDGPGIRYVIFTQGCPHHCLGCHNPQTHDFDGGFEVEEADLINEFSLDPLLSGVTLSGGEPFCQPESLLTIARSVHAAGKNVVAYSGYTYERLCELASERPAIAELLKETDILIDGPFILAERDLDLLFRGSRNQRLLKLKNGEIISSE